MEFSYDSYDSNYDSSDDAIKKEVIELPEQVASLIKHYKEAITNAISIAVDRNLESLKGHTVIFADVSGSMK